MRSSDEIHADAVERRPFSNGTSYEIWAASGRGCYDCRHDKPDIEKYCPILGAALLGLTPKEWVEQGVQEPDAVPQQAAQVSVAGAVDSPGEALVIREWLLTVNAPDRWLTANDRSHRQAQAPVIAAWRRATYQMAQAARLPKGLVKVRIEPIARFAGRAPVREMPNLSPTIKAAVDGLGPERRGRNAHGMPWIAPGYGLVPDDDDKHVELAQTVVGEPLPRGAYGPLGQLLLRIIDLSEVAR